MSSLMTLPQYFAKKLVCLWGRIFHRRKNDLGSKNVDEFVVDIQKWEKPFFQTSPTLRLSLIRNVITVWQSWSPTIYFLVNVCSHFISIGLSFGANYGLNCLFILLHKMIESVAENFSSHWNNGVYDVKWDVEHIECGWNQQFIHLKWKWDIVWLKLHKVYAKLMKYIWKVGEKIIFSILEISNEFSVEMSAKNNRSQQFSTMATENCFFFEHIHISCICKLDCNRLKLNKRTDYSWKR